MAKSHRSNCSCMSRRRPSKVSFSCWFLCLLAAGGSISRWHTNAAPLRFQPGEINKTCKYSAYSVPAALFFNGTKSASGNVYLFPLDLAAAMQRYPHPWQACFGPGEALDTESMLQQRKLPCYYNIRADGSVDYWEEQGCNSFLKPNCYCYSLGVNVGSYCSPGFGSSGEIVSLPITSCAPIVWGTIADGAVPVDRATIYTKPPPEGAHYIATAVMPGSVEPYSGGDFHYWRLDEDGAWSYKAGDTMARNTFRNGTPVHDVEVPEARGLYTEFCGYFVVYPATHKLKGTGWWYSSVPQAYEAWGANGLETSVAYNADMISLGWMANYAKYYWDNGWENLALAYAQGKEALSTSSDSVHKALQPSRVVPASGRSHWHSAVPAAPIADRV